MARRPVHFWSWVARSGTETPVPLLPLQSRCSVFAAIVFGHHGSTKYLEGVGKDRMVPSVFVVFSVAIVVRGEFCGNKLRVKRWPNALLAMLFGKD